MRSEKSPTDPKINLKKKIATNASAAFLIAASALSGAGCITPDAISKSFSCSLFSSSQSNLPNRFDVPPAQRQPEISSQISSTLPSIQEYNDPRYFIPKISFRLKEKPPIQKTIKVFTSDRKPMEKQITEYFFSFYNLCGYLVAKEMAQDGSLMLAVEVPKENKLLSQADLNKSFISLDNKDSHEQADNSGDVGNISDVIVWLKLANTKASGIPFGLSAQWAEDFSEMGTSLSHRTSSAQEVYGYLRVGDPVSASGDTAMSAEIEKQLVKNFQTAKGNVTYEEAEEEYSEMANQNADTIRSMMQDSTSAQNSPSLKENLQNKTYILNVNQIEFVPRSQ